jgi:hypothetical protein
MRRLLALTLPVIGALGMLPAAATPVSTGRVAAVTFTLQPAEGVTLDVEVTALASSAGDRLEVSLRRCEVDGCDYPRYYAGPLPRGAVSIDSSKAVARLRTDVSGLPLDVDWTEVPPGTVLINGTHGGGTGDDFAFTVYRSDPAQAQVDLAGLTCHGGASVGDEVHIESTDGSAGDTRPLRALHLTASRPACEG